MVGRALASMVGQSFRDREIIVVDNASDASDEIAQIVAGFPEARLIRSEVNLGFTGGMNLGLRHATGRYVFLTEDDIVAEPECLEILHRHAVTHPETGLLSGLLFDDRDCTLLSAGGDITLGARYRARIIGRGELDKNQFSEPFDVTYVPCGVALAPREVLLRLGGFREDMVLYSEDVELCFRIAKHGYRITVIPRARFTHLAPPPGRLPEWVEFHKFKNFFSLYILHAPLRVIPIVVLRYGVLSLVGSLARDRRQAKVRAMAGWWVLTHLRRLLVDRWKQ
jgi:GT2 family glycosyltransferase